MPTVTLCLSCLSSKNWSSTSLAPLLISAHHSVICILLPWILSKHKQLCSAGDLCNSNIWYQSTGSSTAGRSSLASELAESSSCRGSKVHLFWSRFNKVTTIVTSWLTTEDLPFLRVLRVFLCRTTLLCVQLHDTNLFQLTTLDLEQPRRSYGGSTTSWSKCANFRFNPCSGRLNPALLLTTLCTHSGQS